MEASHLWTMGTVGDVYVNRDDPQDAFAHAGPLLRSVDLLFGNCEGTYTDRPSPSPGAGWAVVSRTANAVGLRAAGFRVMACANNHILDGGYDGLDDTLTLLRGQGIQAIGAGADLAQARAPAILDQGGIKVGFLAVSCVQPPGYVARPRMPGVAAIRIHTHYVNRDDDPYAYVEPGLPPHVLTFPRREDAAALRTSIEELRKAVDIVVTSFHWGTSRYPAQLMDYEIALGHQAIDNGADIVLGHHHHFLRGVEFYRGKPIAYGLGHFVFDIHSDKLLSKADLEHLKMLDEYAIFPREGYPLLPFHPDARMTMMAAFRFRGRDLADVGIVPCNISPANHAVPASAGSPGHERVMEYLRSLSAKVGHSTRYLPGGFALGEWTTIRVEDGAAIKIDLNQGEHHGS